MQSVQPQQQQITVTPEQQLSVSLQAQQWNQVIAVLHDAPYRIAQPLIRDIGEQLQQQTQAVASGVGNGLDPHPPVTQ
jgi:hypothetical protein